MQKWWVFFVMPLKHVLSVMGLVDHPGTLKLWAIAHKNGHTRKNSPKMQKWWVFFVMPLKHVLSVMGLVDHPRTPKLWVIAHKNGHTRKNDKSFLSFLSSVQTFIFLVNLHGTPKQWAIAHKNGPKTQKWRVFGHASQTCTEWHGPCKSLRNPKTVGHSSWKRP
jgi:hypothetical protein